MEQKSFGAMLGLFVLVFACFVPSMLAMIYKCNPQDPCGCAHKAAIIGRIHGGENASKDVWGWTVSILDGKDHFCGGSILNEHYIITAAHCFGRRMNSLSSITICAGTTRLNSACRQSRKIKNLSCHPSFNEETFQDDIALIQVNTPFNFADTSIARICLPNITDDEEYLTSGTNVTTVGWGKNGEGQWPDILQQVTIQVVDEGEDYCDYDSILYNHSTKLCAAAPGKDACEGDSGGPLMFFTNSKRWELVGITSYGKYENCATEYPGIYTRVTAYLTWIRQSMNNSPSRSLLSLNKSNFGVYTWRNGDRYEGYFKDHKMHGRGTMYFKNGQNYTGNWIAGRRTGQGVYTWPDGKRYEGEFKNSTFHGRGKMTYADGTITNGAWSDHRFIS